MISWLPIGLGVSFFAFMWWQLRRGTRFALLLEPGILALAERRFDRAAEEFRSVMRAYKRQSQYVAVARINLAHALFRQGDLRGATAEAIGVEQTIGLIWSSDVRTHATLLLARLYAVQGETAAAERWIAEGRKRLARSGSRLVIAASLRIAEAIVCCRQGRFGEAAEMLDQDMRRIEAALAVSDLAVVWLLRAFAAAQLTSPRDAGAVTPFIAVLRTQPPGTFDHLAGQWPELAMFLAENGLAAVESV